MAQLNTLTANGMGVGALGLSPGDSCYDASRSWYQPNFWMTDAECACVVQEGRPLGEQCASVSGVAQTMGHQAGAVTGDVVSGAGEGFGAAVGSVASGLAGTLNLTGLSLLLAVGFGAYLILGRQR